MDKKILVPLDGSSISESILPDAVAAARATGRGLILLNVIELNNWAVTAAGGMPVPAFDEEDLEFLQKQAHEYLNGVASELERKYDVPLTTVLLEGDAAVDIPRYAELHPEVSMIAMSTHGRTGLKRWLFGSVAERVLEYSKVPVLLSRPRKAADHSMFDAEHPKILVPLDGSTFAEQALEQVRAFGHQIHPELFLVTVLTPQKDEVSERDEHTVARSYLETVSNCFPVAATAVSKSIVRGDPATEILRIADANKVDLIVMSTHGRNALQRVWMGSVALHVLQNSHAPVLMVRAVERVKVKEPALAAFSMI